MVMVGQIDLLFIATQSQTFAIPSGYLPHLHPVFQLQGQMTEIPHKEVHNPTNQSIFD